jgi:hypothetical protein
MFHSSKKLPSVTMHCALCSTATDISDGGVAVSFCCENPICPECSSKPLQRPTFCLICYRPQRLSDGGILYAQNFLKYIFPDEHWQEKKRQIETFFAKAKKMPGCSFFFQWNQYSWKNLNTPEIAEKYKIFCEEMNKTTYIYFWTRFCSLRGFPIVSPSMFACSKSYIIYSTHPFFPWVPERRKVMSRCHFGVISTIVKRLVAEKQGDRIIFYRRFLMQILHRFLAGR